MHTHRQWKNGAWSHTQPAGKRRGVKYEPPPQSSVMIRTLDCLNDGVRTVIPEQQARLAAVDNIWCVGDTSLLLKKIVAIVGTREVSAEGRARSRKLARWLVGAGVVVMSGLARGVDTEAIEAALEAKGNVAAVIGTPVDRAYPAENTALQERIYREHMLISQFAPGKRVYQSNFPERNKLMAALSDATAIIEAGDTSGTLHQASECVRLGRWLFIARNIVETRSLQWPSRFLHEPVCRVFDSIEDILFAIGAEPHE